VNESPAMIDVFELMADGMGCNEQSIDWSMRGRFLPASVLAAFRSENLGSLAGQTSLPIRINKLGR
jgi:hypothetical protein